MLEQSDIHDVVVELRLLRAEFEHIVEQNQATGKVMAEVFERLRAVENSIAVISAKQPARTNAWAITAVVISGLVAAITFVNEVSATTLP